MTADPRLLEIARRVYGAPRDGFVTARNDEVQALKDSGDDDLVPRVKAFGKPAVSADLVNRLVRAEAELVAEVRELGVRLRSAQHRTAAADLRDLDRERRGLVHRCVEAAGRLADDDGARASASTLRDVEQTVWAAVVDAGASATLRAGVLVKPLSPSGFGAVDVSEASAVPIEVDTSEEPPPFDPPARPRPAGGKARRAEATSSSRARDQERREARRDLETAGAELAAAEERAADGVRELEESDARVADLQRERGELRDRITAIDDEVRAITAGTRDRKSALRFAERERRAAAERRERAQARLDDLV